MIETKSDNCDSAAAGEKSVWTLLSKFYREHELGEEGGANQNWAKVQLGRFHFYFPNTAGRKRALLFHDVHHLATGYDTDLRGEAEIGAWEIASGCKDFWIAWILNFFGFSMGLYLSPQRTFKAFVRGRQGRNLYGGLLDRESIKRSTVPEIQQVLGLDRPPEPMKFRDGLLFAVWCLPVALPPMVMVGILFWFVFP